MSTLFTQEVISESLAYDAPRGFDTTTRAPPENLQNRNVSLISHLGSQLT